MSLVNKIRNQKGAILLLTLFILSSILVVTLAAADLVLAGLKMNRLTGYSNLAFYAAETGLERVLWEARKNAYTSLGVDETNVFSGNLNNGSSYQVDYYAPDFTFKSIGVYNGVKRSVESTFLVN